MPPQKMLGEMGWNTKVESRTKTYFSGRKADQYKSSLRKSENNEKEAAYIPVIP